MKLGTKGRYAVMAMVDLAIHAHPNTPLSLAAISERQNLPLPYLEQLFMKLRQKQIVKSIRGNSGGYKLSKDANKTSIAEILLAVGETFEATRCPVAQNISSTHPVGCLTDKTRCMTHHLWENLGNQIYDYLYKVTLADVCKPNFGQSFSSSQPTRCQA